MASQQGTLNFTCAPRQRVDVPTDSLDHTPYRSSLYNPSRKPLVEPLNFVGMKTYKQPALDPDRTWDASGVYGRYSWTGPVLPLRFDMDVRRSQI
jgi:hypothetical protein